MRHFLGFAKAFQRNQLKVIFSINLVLEQIPMNGCIDESGQHRGTGEVDDLGVRAYQSIDLGLAAHRHDAAPPGGERIGWRSVGAGRVQRVECPVREQAVGDGHGGYFFLARFLACMRSM